MTYPVICDKAHAPNCIWISPVLNLITYSVLRRVGRSLLRAPTATMKTTEKNIAT